MKNPGTIFSEHALQYPPSEIPEIIEGKYHWEYSSEEMKDLSSEGGGWVINDFPVEEWAWIINDLLTRCGHYKRARKSLGRRPKHLILRTSRAKALRDMLGQDRKHTDTLLGMKIIGEDSRETWETTMILA